MTAGHRSWLSTPRLLRRQFFAGPVASIMLALLVLAGALLATGVPRAVAAMHTAALEDSLEQFPGREIDVITSSRNLPELGASSGGTSSSPTSTRSGAHRSSACSTSAPACPSC